MSSPDSEVSGAAGGENDKLATSTAAGGLLLPDPPSAAEESARKARSRLIKLQNSLGVAKIKQQQQTQHPKFAAAVQSNGNSNDYVNDQNEECDDEEEPYPQMNVDPIESDDEGNRSDASNADDDNDEKNNLFKEGRTHRMLPPQQVMKELREGRGTYCNYCQSIVETPHSVCRGKSDAHVLDQSNSSGSSAGGGRMHQHTANQHHYQLQHQQESQHFFPSSSQLSTKKQSSSSTNNRRLLLQTTNLYSDGIDLLETAASEAREKDEVDALNESINYLRNLQLSSGEQQQQQQQQRHSTTNATISNNYAAADQSPATATATIPRKGAPSLPFPPPPPALPIHDPRSQHRPNLTRTEDDSDDIILEYRARSFSLDNDSSPRSHTGLSSSSSSKAINSFSSSQNNDDHHHRHNPTHYRSLPPPPPPVAAMHQYHHQQQQQQQYRQALSVPSTPIDYKRNRPKITAAEAMNFVMNASSARLHKCNRDKNSRNKDSNDDDDDDDDDYDDEGDKAVERMHAFFNTISRRGDEMPLSIDSGNINDVELLMSKSSFPPCPDDVDDNDDDGDDDDDAFEQHTSLSMHAEAKSPASVSRYAENKHKMIINSAKSQLDRLQMDADRQNSLQADRQNSLVLDEHPSSRNSSKAPLRRTRSIDPPVHDEFGLTSSNSSIVPSVLSLQTANERLYGVETVIPSSSYEHGFCRQSSKDSGSAAPMMTALGPRSKRPGGITGIVLDDASNESKQYRPQTSKGLERTSSYGESGSHGIDPQDTIVDNGSPCDVDGLSQSETERLLSGGDFGDEQSIIQMMSLYSHLLPVGFNAFFCSNDTSDFRPAWDDEDPDETGYIVHRLTDSQLSSVENAFEKMVNSFEQLHAKKVRKGANDINFERDLQEAEMILDEEEKRYNAEVNAARYSAAATSSDEDLYVGSKSESSTRSGSRSSPFLEGANEENDDRDCVPDFPGVFYPGKGKAGEMECFYLPIITKSEKTGFEPTKDLVLKPGSVFANNYLVQSELGSAAFSTAYRCIDLSSERDDEGYQDEVCLKVIKNTKDYFDQSLDEIKILQLLKNTGRVKENNIVEMKSFFYHREHLVIVTELLRQNLYEFGKSIRESRGPIYFTRQRLSHIARQCLIALKFVHELGLMHCDIKPENILLVSYSRALVKVIDFGSSSFVTDRQSSYIQSRSYRAPEVILGLPYGGKIDIWSLGCVLAEMYTGEVTFQNDSEISMLSRIEAICGPFPRHMIANGRNCHRMFTDSGLIYRKIVGRDAEEGSRCGSNDDIDEDMFDVYQPKITTIAARLGFDEDFFDKPQLSDGDEQRALFIDFVSKMLTIDPDLRPTAEEALQHPYILSGLGMTDDDIRYPPDN